MQTALAALFSIAKNALWVRCHSLALRTGCKKHLHENAAKGIIAALQHIYRKHTMFNNTSFATAAQTLQENAQKFNPAAAQEVFKPMMGNLQAWGELAQKQAQAAQASIAQTVESFKSVREPQAAFEAMKASAEQSIALATQNLKDVTALSMAQFNTGVDALEKANPAAASLTKGMKETASTMETTLETMTKGATAALGKAAK